MPKRLGYAEVAKDLKKEYLRRHLESVSSLIESWTNELNPPKPLAPDNHIWGWQSVYGEPSLNNPDDNHMLRRHLRSRALWSHHASREREMQKTWQLTVQLRLEAETMVRKRPANAERKYTAEYVPVALWKAFEKAIGRSQELPFNAPNGQLGLAYGGYRIEELSGTAEERLLVENEYRSFIAGLSASPAMEQIAKSWETADELKTRITAIAATALKSHDIFYACGLCQHLW